MARAYCSCCCPIGSVEEHRALMCTPASTSGRTPSLPLLLDAVVASANRCLILGVRYKPYWIMSDLAALSGLGFALAFSSHLWQVSAFGLCAGILGALSSHKGILEIKAALGAVAARSFLQDCLLIIIPIFIAINIAWDQPLNLTICLPRIVAAALRRHCSDWLFSGRLLLRKTVPVWRSLSGVDFHIGAQWVETVFAESRPKAARLSHTARRIRSPIIPFCCPYFYSLGTTSGGSVHLPSLSHVVCNHTPRTGLLSRHERTSTLWTFFGSSTGMCLRACRRLSVLGLHTYELKTPRPRVPRTKMSALGEAYFVLAMELRLLELDSCRSPATAVGPESALLRHSSQRRPRPPSTEGDLQVPRYERLKARERNSG
jgi:hypothetical protein